MDQKRKLSTKPIKDTHTTEDTGARDTEHRDQKRKVSTKPIKSKWRRSHICSLPLQTFVQSKCYFQRNQAFKELTSVTIDGESWAAEDHSCESTLAEHFDWPFPPFPSYPLPYVDPISAYPSPHIDPPSIMSICETFWLTPWLFCVICTGSIWFPYANAAMIDLLPCLFLTGREKQ